VPRVAALTRRRKGPSARTPAERHGQLCACGMRQPTRVARVARLSRSRRYPVPLSRSVLSARTLRPALLGVRGRAFKPRVDQSYEG
jgi:hypothetical protein